MPINISLNYPNDYSEDTFFIIQLPVELAKNLPEELKIRGEMKDSAIICTRTETYALKEVLTSNMNLLCSTGNCVSGKGAYLEMRNVFYCF